MKAEIGTWKKDRQELHSILPLDTPLAFDLHITHNCNFRCNYCVQSDDNAMMVGHKFKRENMSWELFVELVRQLKEFPRKVKFACFAGTGEPTIHPRLVDMVALIKSENAVQTAQIITNGSLLTPEMSRGLVSGGLDSLKISLQGLDSGMYRKIAGVPVDFNSIYENIRYFSSIRGNCELKVKIADTALSKGDEQKFYGLFGDICDAIDVEHIVDLWQASGVDVSNNTIKKNTTIFGGEQHEIRVCRQRFMNVDILPDGTFCSGGCHRRFGFEHNIREVSIQDQWNSDGFNQIRRSMLIHGRNADPVCRKCQYGQQNWHPEDLLEGHEEEILAKMALTVKSRLYKGNI